MNQKDMNDEMEIDLLDLAYMLMDHWHHLLLCLLAGAVIFNAYAFFGIQPTYQSTSKLYVVSTSDDSVVNLNDLNLGTSLTSDYEELMLSYPVLNRVIEKLNLDMDYETLRTLQSRNSAIPRISLPFWSNSKPLPQRRFAKISKQQAIIVSSSTLPTRPQPL